MEENQNTETTVIKESNRTCSNPSIWKAIMCGLLTFLGAFCAFYVVSDWHFKRMMHSQMPYREFNMAEKMMKKDMKDMDKMFRHQEKKLMQKASANVIHMERTDDEYKVFIDLRAFDNNENNLQVTTNGNILTINGRSIRKSKHNEQISEFQQNYMFGENVKLADLTKETNGNFYIITIPIGEHKDIDD